MPAKTLNCPMCGAPASSDSTQCEHCGARLATVACPSCFGMVFQGAKFCSHCGAKIARAEVSAETPEKCPRCRIEMQAVALGQTTLRECAKCQGIWVDAGTLQKICSDRERQAAVLGAPAQLPTDLIGNVEKNIRYVPCPVCNKLMNRVNFAHCSHVVVDVCKAHGTWFDKDELRQIIEFIRAGGLEKSRRMEIAELERERQLKATEAAEPWKQTDMWGRPNYAEHHLGISAAAAVLRSFFD